MNKFILFRMRYFYNYFIKGGFLFYCIFYSSSGFSSGKEIAYSPITLTAAERMKLDISFELLNEKVMTSEVRVPALIKPTQESIATITARVDGWIMDAPVQVGQKVKKGDVLSTLNSFQLIEINNSVIQAEAELRTAEAVFIQKGKLKEAEIISSNDYLQSKQNYIQAKALFDAAKKRLQQLGITQGTHDPSKKSFSILAPFDGMVLEKNIFQEQVVTSSDILFVIGDLSVMQVEANISEDQLQKIQLGATARVKITAYPDEVFVGKVTYIASSLDKNSRTLPVRITLDNKDGKLKPSMAATVYISYTSKQSVLSVPNTAITMIDGDFFVFAERNNALYPIMIKKGEEGAVRTQITADVILGDNVVINRVYDLKSRLLKSQIPE